MIAGGRGGDTQTMLLVVETDAKLDALKQARTEIAQTEAAVGGLTQKEEKRLSLAQQQFVAMAETGKLNDIEIKNLKRMGVEVAAVTAAREKFVQGQNAATATTASRAVQAKSETAAIAASTGATIENTAVTVANTEAKKVAIATTFTLDRAEGLALARAATGLGQIEAMGKVSTGSIRGIIGGLDDVAAGMGPGGPLLTAVAIAGFALYEFWERQKKEAQDFDKEMQKVLDNLAKRGPEAAHVQVVATEQALGVLDAKVAATEARIRGMDASQSGQLSQARAELTLLKREQGQVVADLAGLGGVEAVSRNQRDQKDAFARAQKARSDAERDITQATGDITRAREAGNGKLVADATARLNTAEKKLQTSVATAKDLAATLARAGGNDPVAARNEIDTEQGAFSDTRTRDAEQRRFGERLRAGEKASAERKRQAAQRAIDQKKADDDFIRSTDMLQQFEDSALQRRLQAHGLVEEAEKAATNREFDRRAAEIEKLKVSEDRKAQLLISAALDRTQAVEAIERKHHDALQADILRNAEVSLGRIRTEQDKEARQQKTANDRVEREEMQKAALIQRILVSSLEQGIRARESFGKLLARAAAGGIASELELLARSELAKSAAHFLTGDIFGGGAHLAASAALEVGAREIGGAGGGGSSGGAGGNPNRDPGTFTPSTAGTGANGGLTLNLITRDPYGRDSIQQTIYEIGRAGILKRQGIAIPPTSGVNVVAH